MTTRPLRTVLLYSAGHIGSATILNKLIDSPEFEIVAVVRSQAVLFSRKGFRQFRKYLQQVGWRFGCMLLWQQVVQGILYALSWLWPFGRKRLLPCTAIARERGIPVLNGVNVNGRKCRAFIAAHHPDLLVSAYFGQILKKRVLDIPRRGALNVHPGWLPAYRGAMCYFWVLKNGEDSGGVSVHWMDEGIDTGAVLMRRSFRLQPQATQHRVLMRTAVIGANLLRRVARMLQRNVAPKPVALAPSERPAYFPMPSAEDYDAYLARRRFFRLRDMIGFLFRPLRRPTASS